MSEQEIENLFSYGTLQSEAVQLATFNRTLTGTPDLLSGHALSLVEIDDPQVVATSGKTHHPIVHYTGAIEDTVAGTVFQITAAELRQSDEYEVGAYVRTAVVLASGLHAWVYVSATDSKA